MRASPLKRRVCAVLFTRSSLKFVRLCLSCYVMRTSPHKHWYCAVLFPRSPLKFARLCLSCYVCLLRLTHIGFVQYFSHGLLHLKFVRLCLSCYVMPTLPHTHRVCAVLFPRSSLKFVRLCLSRCVMCTSPHKHLITTH